MKLGILKSAFDQAGVDTKTGLEHIASIGLDSVDIFTEAATTITDKEETTLIEKTSGENNVFPVVVSAIICIDLL